ncbi:MAG: hypothetical protein ACLUEV_01420 [Alistipes sp.]
MKKRILFLSILAGLGAVWSPAAAASPETPAAENDTVALSPVPQAGLQPAESATAQTKPFLPTRRRIDREINKIKFVYKGEMAAGITVSYGTLSSDDTDYMLILDGINLSGSIFTVNPSFGYFIKDNLSVGARLAIRRWKAIWEAPRSTQVNDVNMSFANVSLSHSASYGAFLRSYAGIDAKGHFGFFAELEFAVKTGSTSLAYESDGKMKYTNSDNLQFRFSFNPGVAVYIFPNVCGTLSFGLGGIQFNKVTQKDPEGNVVGTRHASKMLFRLNLANIRIGLNIHL